MNGENIIQRSIFHAADSPSFWFLLLINTKNSQFENKETSVKGILKYTLLSGMDLATR